MRLNSDMTMCALFLLSCKLVAIMTQDIEKRDLTHERNDFIGSDDMIRGRYKRTLPTVLGKLLAGAKLIFNQGVYRLFSKAGGYTKARSDFESLGLTGIRKTQLGLQGQVEDRTVLLRFVGTMSGDGVIDIMKAKRLKSGDLEPSQINRIRYSNSVTGSKVGQVGDRSVMLSRGEHGGGVIDIWLYKVHSDGKALPAMIDRIRYMD